MRLTEIKKLHQATALGVGFGCLAVFVSSLAAQGALIPQGNEYSLTGPLRGEQTQPHISLAGTQGWVVWQDNNVDGDGLGISARRLDSNSSPSFGSFRVNEASRGNQELPKCIALQDGSAGIVWQSSATGIKRIVGRMLDASGKFFGGEFSISPDNGQDASLALGDNGEWVVTWANYGSDGHMLGVFVQKLSKSGEKIGDVVAVNTTTRYNQKSPAVSKLSDGRFIVVWASEQQNAENTVDIHGRIFNADLSPGGGEFRISEVNGLCANPTVIGLPNGASYVAWSQMNPAERGLSWDVQGRLLQAGGDLSGGSVTLNSHTTRDQFGPKLSVAEAGILAAWTSMGQDGSREGIAIRQIQLNGALGSADSVINSTKVSQQIHPTLASVGDGGWVVAWTSFIGLNTSFDILAQRVSAANTGLAAPNAPIVSPLSSSRLSVTWPSAAGLGVVAYVLKDESSGKIVEQSSNIYTSPALAPSTEGSYTLQYRLASGLLSPSSPVGKGTTLGEDNNGDGLPDDWQGKHFGNSSSAWSGAGADPDKDGASNLKELLAGTNPNDAASVLRTRFENSRLGRRLIWNTQAGLIYQVQTTKDFERWEPISEPRFAAGAVDSLAIDDSTRQSYYRVIRVK